LLTVQKKKQDSQMGGPGQVKNATCDIGEKTKIRRETEGCSFRSHSIIRRGNGGETILKDVRVKGLYKTRWHLIQNNFNKTRGTNRDRQQKKTKGREKIEEWKL